MPGAFPAPAGTLANVPLMARPVIGICTAIEQARWGVWEQDAFLLARPYVDAVVRAGGMVVLLPPDARLLEEPDEALDLIDGLMLAGGVDIDPSAYGASPHAMTQITVPERDAFELALALRAIERDQPLLGICRGMQLLNVALGGTLDQHLPESRGHELHLPSPGTFEGADHDVRLAPGSLAARAAGEELHGIKSHHHQGVARLGDGLEVSGWATVDELPEAIELPDRRFALGVQWHAEVDPTSTVIEAFVSEAAAVAAAANT